MQGATLCLAIALQALPQMCPTMVQGPCYVGNAKLWLASVLVLHM